MPHPCAHPGCPNVVREGRYCPEHAGQEQRRYDAERGTAAERGYDARWRRLRMMFLRANPICVECWRHGRVTPATEVHHIVPRSKGGTDDWDNLEALCKECHSRKTAAEGRWG